MTEYAFSGYPGIFRAAGLEITVLAVLKGAGGQISSSLGDQYMVREAAQAEIFSTSDWRQKLRDRAIADANHPKMSASSSVLPDYFTSGYPVHHPYCNASRQHYAGNQRSQFSTPNTCCADIDSRKSAAPATSAFTQMLTNQRINQKLATEDSIISKEPRAQQD